MTTASPSDAQGPPIDPSVRQQRFENTTTAEQAHFCPSCGEPSGNFRFCPSCGHAIPYGVSHTSAGDPLASSAAPAAPGRSHRVLIIALAAVGLAAIAVAAVILASSGRPATTPSARSAPGADAAYRAKLQGALSPLISANQSLSSSLTAMDGSRQTIHAAQNAASSAQSAVASGRGAINVLNPPSSDQTLSEHVQQGLANENGYVQAVSSTLTTPTSSSAGQLQTLATALQSSLVPLNSLISNASNSVAGASNLTSWANSAAGAASRAQTRSAPSSSSGNSSPGSSSSGNASSSPGAGSNPYANGSGCGSGLFAGPNTSCSFAQNTQQAYNQAPGAVATVQVYSPVTNQTYSMSCAPAGQGVTCSGANSASVSW